jgi:hypothetical protein
VFLLGYVEFGVAHDGRLGRASIPDEVQSTPSDELAIWIFTVWSAAAKFWVA